MKIKSYEVYEDNGGGLYLVTYDDNGKIDYLHTGYEYNPGQLSREDIPSLKDGADPHEDWEGNELDGSSDVAEWIKQDTLVADNWGIYPASMGRTAKMEFEPRGRFDKSFEAMGHSQEEICGMSDEELAAEIKSADEWDVNLLRDLCYRADMLLEWSVTDDIGDGFKAACEAAKILGVDIE